MHLVGPAGGRRDQHDSRHVTAAQRDEPLEQPGAAAPVLRAPDNEQAAGMPAVVPLVVHAPSSTSCYPSWSRMNQEQLPSGAATRGLHARYGRAGTAYSE